MRPEEILTLRIVVLALGEQPPNPWWRSQFLTAIGLNYLTYTFPRSAFAAAVRSATLAARHVHDSAIGKGAVAHLFRLEVTVTTGTGKLRTPSGLEPGIKESLNRAFAYLQAVKSRLGIDAQLAQQDIDAEAVDLSSGHIAAQCGVAFYVEIVSALQNRRIAGATVILGDLTIQGNVRGVTSLIEPLTIAMENGAQQALVPSPTKASLVRCPKKCWSKWTSSSTVMSSAP
jgi:ATP-dependent Lon protease